jgi:hypothetical protein
MGADDRGRQGTREVDTRFGAAVTQLLFPRPSTFSSKSGPVGDDAVDAGGDEFAHAGFVIDGPYMRF